MLKIRTLAKSLGALSLGWVLNLHAADHLVAKMSCGSKAPNVAGWAYLVAVKQPSFDLLEVYVFRAQLASSFKQNTAVGGDERPGIISPLGLVKRTLVRAQNRGPGQGELLSSDNKFRLAVDQGSGKEVWAGRLEVELPSGEKVSESDLSCGPNSLIKFADDIVPDVGTWG